jgi:hypothetical protein
MESTAFRGGRTRGGGWGGGGGRGGGGGGGGGGGHDGPAALDPSKRGGRWGPDQYPWGGEGVRGGGGGGAGWGVFGDRVSTLRAGGVPGVGGQPGRAVDIVGGGGGGGIAIGVSPLRSRKPGIRGYSALNSQDLLPHLAAAAPFRVINGRCCNLLWGIA